MSSKDMLVDFIFSQYTREDCLMIASKIMAKCTEEIAQKESPLVSKVKPIVAAVPNNNAEVKQKTISESKLQEIEKQALHGEIKPQIKPNTQLKTEYIGNNGMKVSYVRVKSRLLQAKPKKLKAVKGIIGTFFQVHKGVSESEEDDLINHLISDGVFTLSENNDIHWN